MWLLGRVVDVGFGFGFVFGHFLWVGFVVFGLVGFVISVLLSQPSRILVFF